MKKLILVLLLLLCILPVTAEEETVPKRGEYNGIKYIAANGSVTVYGYSGNYTSIVIPEKIDGYPVTRISNFSADGNVSGAIKRVIERGVGYVSTISESPLKSIAIPKTVTKINNGAFAAVPNLNELIVDAENAVYYSKGNCIMERETKMLICGCKGSRIPEEVTTIAESAFHRILFKQFTIPQGVTNIGENCFSECEELARITLPNTLRNIGDYAFSDCAKLRAFHIPASVTDIGKDIIQNCTQLESITVSAENPVYYADKNCLILRENKAIIAACLAASIPEDIEEINDGAFRGFLTEKEIILPNSLKRIGEQALANNSSLKSLHIPASVEEIGAGIVSRCAFLTSITVEESNPAYFVEGGCLIRKSDNALIAVCCTNITIPASVTRIEKHSCNNFKGKSMSLPASITAIGENAFGNPSLSSIDYAGSKAMWDMIMIDEENSLLNKCRLSFALSDEETFALADTDNDGIIRAKDAILALRALSNDTIPDADINRDESFTNEDVLWILKFCASE